MSVKNAFIPVVSLIGLQLPILVGGSVIMENIFNLPGLGRLMVDALQTQRLPGGVRSEPVVRYRASWRSTCLPTLLYPYLDPRVAL